MTRALLAVTLALALPACTDGYVGAGVRVDGQGVEFRPSVGSRIGGLTVGVQG